MGRLTALALIFVGLAISTHSYGQNRERNKGISPKVVGTWKLISMEATRPSGEVIRDWGEHPIGLLIYDLAGHMSVQFMRDPRPTAASKNLTTEEKSTAYDGYLAYFGTYELNEKEGMVIHHVQSSLRPHEVGIDYKRSYKLAGNRLVLTTLPMEREGELRVYRLVWERVNNS